MDPNDAPDDRPSPWGWYVVPLFLFLLSSLMAAYLIGLDRLEEIGDSVLENETAAQEASQEPAQPTTDTTDTNDTGNATRAARTPTVAPSGREPPVPDPSPTTELEPEPEPEPEWEPEPEPVPEPPEDDPLHGLVESDAKDNEGGGPSG